MAVTIPPLSLRWVGYIFSFSFPFSENVTLEISLIYWDFIIPSLESYASLNTITFFLRRRRTATNRAEATLTWSSCLNMLIPSSKMTTKRRSSLSSSILGIYYSSYLLFSVLSQIRISRFAGSMLSWWVVVCGLCGYWWEIALFGETHPPTECLPTQSQVSTSWFYVGMILGHLWFFCHFFPSFVPPLKRARLSGVSSSSYD